LVNNFLKRQKWLVHQRDATKLILNIIITIISLVTGSLFVAVLLLSQNIAYTEWESLYFLILTFIVIIATLYLWNWLSKTQFLILQLEEKKKIEEKKKQEQKQKRNTTALPDLISIIMVCMLTGVSVALLALVVIKQDYLFLSVSFLGLSTAVLAFFSSRTYASTHSMSYVDEPADSAIYEFINSGTLLLPKKVRVGDSENLYLMCFATTPSSSDSYIHRNADNDQRHLRITLEGAGLKIAGENPRRYSLKSLVLSDYWNCSFPLSGNQLINLKIDLVKEKDKTFESVSVFEHNIFVTNFLRETWKPLLIIAPAIITSVSIVLATLH